jgi:hypothetical protein
LAKFSAENKVAKQDNPTLAASKRKYVCVGSWRRSAGNESFAIDHLKQKRAQAEA